MKSNIQIKNKIYISPEKLNCAMTETHTGSQYLLQPIALDKPAVWLVNPKHII